MSKHYSKPVVEFEELMVLDVLSTSIGDNFINDDLIGDL